MKTALKFFLMVFLITAFTGCANPTKNIRINEKNEEKVLGQIKNSKDLTFKEVDILIAHVSRAKTAAVFTGQKPDYFGKTIGQIIEEEGNFQARQAKLAGEATKEEAKIAKELSSYILVSVYKKGFAESDYSAGRYDDYVSLSLIINNVGTREVRAFKGRLILKDLFGEKIQSYRIDYDKFLKSGKKVRETFYCAYNQFVDKDVKIKNTELENMKIEWFPTAIIFKDGTKMGDIKD